MFEAYRVAVRIALHDGVTAGLLGLSGQFRKMHGDVAGVNTQLDALERRMKSARNWMIGGAAMAGAGMAGLAALKSPIQHAIELDREVQKFRLFGMGEKVTAEALKFARGMNSIGTSYVDTMKRMSEAQGAMRESGLAEDLALRKAKLATPILNRIAFVNSTLDDESGAKMNTSSMAMLRFLEQRGAMNSPEAFERAANAGFKTVRSSGGGVNWEQLRQFSTIAGSAGQNLTDEALYGWYEPIINELKGKSAGDGTRTAYNRISGIVKLPNQAAHELVRMKLWDESQVEWNAQGGIKRFKGNPLRHADEYAQNPLAWYEKYVMPDYAKRKLSPEAIGRENAMLFGGTGGRMFNLEQRQIEMIHHSVDAWRKALNIDEATSVAENSPSGKIVIMKKRWENALTDFGEGALPGAIVGVEKLTVLIKTATAWMERNPELAKQGIKDLGISLLGLTLAGGMSVVVGGVKAVSAMLGLVGTSATLLTTGPASLAAVATGMTRVGMALRGLGVLGAGAAGAAVGTAVYEATAGTWYGDHVGSQIGRVGKFLGFKHAAEAVDAMDRYDQFMRPGASNPTVKRVIEIKLDSRTVWQGLDEHVNRIIGSGAAQGTTQFDPSFSVPPLALPGGLK